MIYFNGERLWITKLKTKRKYLKMNGWDIKRITAFPNKNWSLTFCS
jgi:hypothetical protein